MILMTPCAGQERRHRHKGQTFQHSGGRRGWDDLRGWHGNICISVCRTGSKWEFDV